MAPLMGYACTQLDQRCHFCVLYDRGLRMGLISFLAGAFKQVSGRGKGTRPDGSPWWQVRVRLPNGLVIEVDPYGTERYHWHTKDGKYHRSRNKPKDLG